MKDWFWTAVFASMIAFSASMATKTTTTFTTVEPYADMRAGTLHSLIDLQAHTARNTQILEWIFQRQMDTYSLASVRVTITAYTARAAETDNTPHLTADNTLATVGRIAVSRDMLLYLNYGDRVLIPSYGVFVVSDTMNKRYKARVDILMGNVRAAREFGVHKNERLVFIL